MPRSYATPADLENFTGTDAPEDAQRLLQRASEEVDTALMTSVYATDTLGFPTDVAKREAMRDAACAVVEWWSTDKGTGDETGAQGVWSSVSAGAVAMSKGGGASGTSGSTSVRPGWLPPRAHGFLSRAGLLSSAVYTR